MAILLMIYDTSEHMNNRTLNKYANHNCGQSHSSTVNSPLRQNVESEIWLFFFLLNYSFSHSTEQSNELLHSVTTVLRQTDSLNNVKVNSDGSDNYCHLIRLTASVSKSSSKP